MTHPMLAGAPKCTRVLDGERRIDGSQEDATCKREDGHRGLHRDSWAIHDDTLKWGDDVCRPADKPKCGSVFVLDETKICARQPGHMGLHNPLDGTTPWWGGNEGRASA